ncbi:MAG: hypothetical protein FJW26_14835 [Acidimicrobiia bacterium]|nr:hypothetical protein [Acidimicrobiia bacterium]
MGEWDTPAEGAEPVGTVAIKVANVRAAVEGIFEISVEVSPLAVGQAVENPRTVKLKKGETLKSDTEKNRPFEFQLDTDAFDWNVKMVSVENEASSPPMFISGTISLVDVVQLLNQSEQQLPYDFGRVNRPDPELLEVTDSPVSMEFKDVHFAAVGACVIFETHEVSELPDYRVWFDANGNSGQEDSETVSGTLKKVGIGWCTRSVFVISKEATVPFTFEYRNPRTGRFEPRAKGVFRLESGDVADVTTVSAQNISGTVPIQAISVGMFGAKDSFEVTLGNPFVSSLMVKGLDQGAQKGVQVCAGELPCQAVPPPRPAEVVANTPWNERVLDFLNDKRAFAPLAVVGLVAAAFVAVKIVRRLPA